MEIIDTGAIVTNPGRNFVTVQIKTDQGHVGYGDATLNGREQAVYAALVEHILPELESRDSRRIEDIWQMLFRQTYWRGGPVLNSALSGVDMALWDLKGKYAGLPVYDLLGGRTRDYAAVYQHVGGQTVEDTVAALDDELDRGITHFRVNAGKAFTPGRRFDATKAAEDVRTVREAIGPEPELLIDVHGRATPSEAATLCKRLEPANMYFVEDPIRPEFASGFERIREQTSTPLAMGELFTNPWEMQVLIERDLIDFIRVDLAHIGGITAAQKLAHIGEHHYVRTAFHGPGDLSPVGQAATVHLDVSLANFGVQELTEHDKADDNRTEVFSGGATFRNDVGGLDVSDDPGLGIDVDWEAAQQYGFEPSNLPRPRADDGSVVDW